MEDVSNPAGDHEVVPSIGRSGDGDREDEEQDEQGERRRRQMREVRVQMIGRTAE